MRAPGKRVPFTSLLIKRQKREAESRSFHQEILDIFSDVPVPSILVCFGSRRLAETFNGPEQQEGGTRIESFRTAHQHEDGRVLYFSRRINVSRLIGKRATVCLLAPEEADCSPKVELDAKQLRFIVSRLALTGLAFIFPSRE